MAAGGLAAGGAAGAAGMRGAARRAPAAQRGVKGIGATTRPSGPGSLSRGATPGAAPAPAPAARRAAPRSAGPAAPPAPRVPPRGSRQPPAPGSRLRHQVGRPRAPTQRRRRAGAGAVGPGRARPRAPAKGAGKGRGLFRRGSNGSAAGDARRQQEERRAHRAARRPGLRAGLAGRRVRRHGRARLRSEVGSGHHGGDGLRRVCREVERRRRSTSLHELGTQRGHHRAVVGAQARARHAHPDALRASRAPRPSRAAGCWRPPRRR